MRSATNIVCKIELCGYSSSDLEKLIGHLDEHLETEFQECFFCSTVTFKEGDLLIHILSHISVRLYLCGSCEDFHVRQDYMEKHIRNSHNGNSNFMEVERRSDCTTLLLYPSLTNLP